MKRLFDLSFASLLFILLSPLLFVIAMMVKLFVGSPILFKQIRPGIHGKPFIIYKFRSMTDARSLSGKRLPDEQRLVPFGRFLRSTSLDELPELINVIKGEMSLVGPRPLLIKYLKLYTPLQARRHEVKPGITGWAQVNGRNAITWEKKFKMDVWYVDNHSVTLDLRIIVMTFGKMITREGITQPGKATAEEFNGTAKLL